MKSHAVLVNELTLYSSCIMWCSILLAIIIFAAGTATVSVQLLLENSREVFDIRCHSATAR